MLNNNFIKKTVFNNSNFPYPGLNEKIFVSLNKVTDVNISINISVIINS